MSNGLIRRSGPGLASGLSCLAPVALLCFVAPLVWSRDPDRIVASPFLAPSLEHPFGTDGTGRDLLARVAAGGRLDLLIAVLVVVLAAVIGTVVGVVAAMSMPVVDRALMRLVDAVLAFPFLVLVLALTVIIGPLRAIGPLPSGVPAIVVAIVLVDWAVYARIARARATVLRSRDDIVASTLLGYSRWRIVRRHVAPRVMGAIAAYAASDVVLVVVATASLSFIGVGVQPPTAEWGSIMYEGRAVLGRAWWITTVPGIALALTGLGMSLVVDAFAERPTSPRHRRTQTPGKAA